jgi:hypothetical protein
MLKVPVFPMSSCYTHYKLEYSVEFHVGVGLVLF